MARKLDRALLLERLEPIRYTPRHDSAREELEALSLADSLLMLAELTHDKVYQLYHAVALHLRGQLLELDVELEDEL